MQISCRQKVVLSFILFLFIIAITFQTYAQKYPRNPITAISLEVSPTFTAEYDTVFEIGLTIDYKSGKRRKTRGMHQGTKSWKKFDIKVNHGHFDKGIIFFNREAILNTPVKDLIITVSPIKQSDFQKEFKIEIPYIKSISLEYDSSSSLVPGFEIPYWIKAEYSSGKVFYSQHRSNKAISHNSNQFHIALSDYVIDSPDPLIIKEKSVTLPISDTIIYSSIILKAVHKKIDSLNHEFQIPINYGANYFINFQGFSGNQGSSGFSGYDSDVGDGGDGGKGEVGENGEDGIDIKIYALDQYIWNNDTLVHIAFESEYGIETIIVDANKGKINVQCNGGDGGKGGSGGMGGSGGDQTEEYEVGWGGNGGMGGDGGDGGDGCIVTLFTSDKMAVDSSLFIIENNGGKAGPGGSGGVKGIGGSELEDPEAEAESSLLLVLLVAVAEAIISPYSGNKGSKGDPGKSGKDGALLIIEESQIKNQFERGYRHQKF